MELLILIVFTLSVSSIFPAVAFCAGVHGVKSTKEISSYFNRTDASKIFTDAKLIELRERYCNSFKSNRNAAVIYSIIFFALITKLILDDLTYTNISSWEKNAPVLISLGHVYVGTFVFNNLGRSYGLVQATKPINKTQRNELEFVIKSSESPEVLINFINSNPKETLVYIDVLNLKHAANKLKSEHEKMPIPGLRK
jgi:hypothetical protein